MLPHERSLVAKYAGRPFVVVGVSAEPSREALRRAEEKLRLPWRSWWDGPNGPIAAAWGVGQYPTFVLLDKRGAVRFRHAGGLPPKELEARIEGLLDEAP
jgi:hypothetical protein